MSEMHKHNHEECNCGHEHHHEHGGEVNKKEFWTKIIISGVFFIAGYIINEAFTQPASLKYAAMACFAVSYLVVGFEIIREAVEGIMHKNFFNENFLMAIAPWVHLQLANMPKAAQLCCYTQ